MEKAMLIKYKPAIAGVIGDSITILVPAKTDFKGYILMIKWEIIMKYSIFGLTGSNFTISRYIKQKRQNYNRKLANSQ